MILGRSRENQGIKKAINKLLVPSFNYKLIFTYLLIYSLNFYFVPDTDPVTGVKLGNDKVHDLMRFLCCLLLTS